MTIGRSVRLYLVDGTASGIITAEIINWTGHVLIAPRTRLEAVLGREELKRTGVYLIFGSDDPESSLPLVYVGEGDDIGKRLYSHNRDDSKQFWEKFNAITNKDLNLTKAHVRYLESRLIEILKLAKKVRLANSDHPTFDRLPEADKADMETFLSEIELVLPVVGVDFLKRPKRVGVQQGLMHFGSGAYDQKLSGESQPTKSKTPKVEGDHTFSLRNSKAGINAKAMELDGEFVILSGSRGSLKEKTSFMDKIKSLRDAAFDSGRAVKLDDATFETTENIALTSPSAAAVFLFGTSRNGRTDWIEEQTGMNYGTWKDSMIDAAQVSKGDD